MLGVASGALQPGQRLVEVELARLLQMSRVPLREALKILGSPGHRRERAASRDPYRHLRRGADRRDLRGTPRAGEDRDARRDGSLSPRSDARSRGWTRSSARWSARRRASGVDRDQPRRPRFPPRDLPRLRQCDRAEALGRLSPATSSSCSARKSAASAMPRRSSRQHKQLRDILAAGRIEALDDELDQHILRLQRRKGKNVR